jgi:hypothetical protein
MLSLYVPDTGSTKILEGKFREKIFYYSSDHKPQEKAIQYLLQGTKDVCVMVQKIQYLPQGTKIICTCYMHFMEP